MVGSQSKITSSQTLAMFAMCVSSQNESRSISGQTRKTQNFNKDRTQKFNKDLEKFSYMLTIRLL